MGAHFGKEIKRMPSVSLCIRSCNVTQRFHSYLYYYDMREIYISTADTLWKVQVRGTEFIDATQQIIPTEVSRDSCLWITELNRAFTVPDGQHFFERSLSSVPGKNQPLAKYQVLFKSQILLLLWWGHYSVILETFFLDDHYFIT